MARIIVVDDEPRIVSIMGKLLSIDKHAVTEVQQSDVAEQLIKDEEFDLMISDVRMNPINGIELLKLARKERPQMAVIMITAYHSPELSKEAMKQGAFAYLPKPFQVGDILAAIDKALANPAAN